MELGLAEPSGQEWERMGGSHVRDDTIVSLQNSEPIKQRLGSVPGTWLAQTDRRGMYPALPREWRS